MHNGSNGHNGPSGPPAVQSNKPLPAPFNYLVLTQPVAMRRSIVSEFNKLLAQYLTLGPTDNPLQLIHELQVALRWMQRVERRIFIRRAFTCSKENHRAYNEQLKHWDGPGRQPDEDYWAVMAHLDEGCDMFAGMRKPKSG